MSNLEVREIVCDQFSDLVARYPTLMLHWEDQIGIIEGELQFRATFNDIEIEDTYSIKIEIPSAYPHIIPKTWETGNRIPDDFHKYTNGGLCLETPTKQYIGFSSHPTLLFYVEKFVVEYLYGYSHLQRFGSLPYGECDHGPKGIFGFYKELFGVNDYDTIMRLLYVLSFSSYRGHLLCPCGSGQIGRRCHGDMLLQLLSLNLKDHFYNDFMQLYELKSNLQRRNL